MPTDATPLLESQQQRVQVPLPTAQLFALWVSRLTDPISYTQIFPYINQFLLVLHVTEDISKVGFYSGLVESTFAVTQTLSTYSWARLSDVVGRRPIILFGASGLAVVTILLGFCTSLTQIIIVRAVAGFLAGNLAVFHAILAEITHESNQAVAYPIYSSSWPLGAVIGPLIGGSLSNLGTKYPNIWGYDFVLAHPYFMPNFVCTVLVLLGLSLAYVFLEETLPSKRPGSFNRAEIVQSTPYGVRNLLANPKMRAVTASSFMLAFVGAAFDVVFVLFCYTPIQQGGLSFSVDKIGLALALSGCILVVFQLIFMPMLLRRIKAANLYNYCIRMWPLTFLLMPSLNLILRRGYNPEIDDPATNILLWLSMTFLLVCSRIAALAYGTQMILVKDIAPTTALGEANGLVQVAMGAARCFSPAFISSIFALSIDNNVLGGYPIWVAVMLVVCLGSCYLSEQLIEMKGADKES